MVLLWLLGVMMLPICTISEILDQQCKDNCSCCKEGKCGSGIYGWTNVCTIGCIDGHYGARCYAFCQYENCKSCGSIGSDRTCTACYDGYYLGPNKDCTSQCPSNCKSCTSSTTCTECKEGFYDKDGSMTCKYADCPANCNCNYQGDCTSCKKGYYDTSTSCTKQCPVNCTQCQSYDICLQCIGGKYGSTCQEDCSVGCKDKTCIFNSGQCECKEDFTGNKCNKCVDGKYGTFCNETCPKFCKENICEKTSGDCSGGCLNENMSGSTCNTCMLGMFGDLCDKICPENCQDIRCERYNSICNYGCTTNFKGTKCDQCIYGKYGNKCELNCPVKCAGKVCDRNSGICFECIENFQGSMCDECKPGYYGKNCDVSCPLHCANYPCNRNTGNCVYGCKNGYSGDKCCVMSENCIECQSKTECRKCVPGFFKSSCNETCPGSCDGLCHITTGECILSKESQQQKDASNSGLIATAAVLGTLFTLLFTVNIVLLVLFMLKKIKVSRRTNCKTERDQTYENQLKSVSKQSRETTRDATDAVSSETVEGNIYDGISRDDGKDHEYQQLSYNHGSML